MTLDRLSVGSEAIITTVKDGELRLRLLDMGLTPRTSVKIIKTAPLGDPVQIRLRGYELTLQKHDLKSVEVAIIKRG
ncbi:MAG: ferrous iron transport protein A [Eubacteriales bacterium]